MGGFICPHCYKQILYSELEIVCPFCNYEHVFKKDEFSVYKTYGKNRFKVYPQAMVIFKGCFHCYNKIRYIDCIHCEHHIDLFAPYDVKSLERKRYGE